MNRRDQLLPILAQLDGHVADDDCSSVDADRWRAEKRHIARMKDPLDLARIELERTRLRGARRSITFGGGSVEK